MIPLDYTGGNPAPTVISTLTLQKVITYNGWYPLTAAREPCKTSRIITAWAGDSLAR